MVDRNCSRRLLDAVIGVSILTVACGAPVKSASPEPASELTAESVSVEFPVTFEVLREKESIEQIGINLSPGTGVEPRVEGSAAFEKAWHEEGRGLGPDSAVVTLARLQGEQFGLDEATPVWLVSLKGICLPVFGPKVGGNDELPECAGHELVTAVNAQTGAYMFSYSYR